MAAVAAGLISLSSSSLVLTWVSSEAQPISCHMEPERLGALVVVTIDPPPSRIQLGREVAAIVADAEVDADGGEPAAADVATLTTPFVCCCCWGNPCMALAGTLTSWAVATLPSPVVKRTVVPPSDTTLYGTFPDIT